MVITKSQPYTEGEINQLRELFDTYVKTVVDVEKGICSAGADRHYESEKILLEQGSNQRDLWGGGIDLDTREIDFNSFINIRPSENNTSNEIQNITIRDKFEKLMKFFFKEL